jgi:hypothetical protein
VGGFCSDRRLYVIAGTEGDAFFAAALFVLPDISDKFAALKQVDKTKT